MNEPAIKRLKRIIVDTAYQTGEGHIASSFSILDIMYVLTHKVMHIDREHLCALENDHLVVSKGHASIGLYAVLSDLGFFPQEALAEFGKRDSMLGGHPDRNKVPGVDISTGSLGHGLPNAIGLAYGLKLQKIPAKVYVIVGDGELNEGTMWEAALLASHFKLQNLCCIVDNNHSIERAINLTDIGEKFASFGWQVSTVNGHCHEDLEDVLKREFSAPHVVVADTIKGQGCSMMETNPMLWHHKSPTPEEYQQIMEELR